MPCINYCTCIYIYFHSLHDTFPSCVYLGGWCMYLFVLMKHLIFLYNIAILPFATITPQGLYPQTRAILSDNIFYATHLMTCK